MTLEKVSIKDILEAQRMELERLSKEKERKEQLLRQKGLLLTREIPEDIFS